MLAAVNFVETGFGKLRSRSSAGAQGPMQFLPATWRAYGLGGDVHDPRDAILGAANYLRASGAPRDLRRALYAYNHSTRYVDAVVGFAAQIRRDVTIFFAYHAWQVFIKTPSGPRRIPAPEEAGGVGRGGAPTCARPSFVITRPRGVRWRKPSWSRYGS